MQAEGIQQLLQILTENGMLCCVVGEFALNYYNVPVVIHVWFSPFVLRSS
jgi:hypothetical protein